VHERVLIARRVHVDVFALDVDDDDGPAGGRRFLDQHLGRVGFAGADGAKDADIARQHALVLALQTHVQVVLAVDRAEQHVARDAEEVADFGVGEFVYERARCGTRLGVDRVAVDEFALDFELCLDGLLPHFRRDLGAVGKERPGHDAAEEAGA
jgi:hypothetical protein